MMNPLPSVAQAFSLLIQDEKQREVRPNNLLMMESASINVNTSRNISLPIMESTSLNANVSRNDNFKTNYSTGNHPKSRPRPFCDYCKRPGHTKDKCFKLHGYPQNNNFNPRFNKGKRISANMHGAPVESIPVKDDGMSSQGCSDINNMNSPLNLTKEQYGQLFNLLQQFHIGGGGENTTSPGLTNGNANFASIFACSASVLSIDFGLLSCRCFTPSVDL
nr:uncharacterized protein LOC117276932 [Nicotiana tomentosiformis]